MGSACGSCNGSPYGRDESNLDGNRPLRQEPSASGTYQDGGGYPPLPQGQGQVQQMAMTGQTPPMGPQQYPTQIPIHQPQTSNNSNFGQYANTPRSMQEQTSQGYMPQYNAPPQQPYANYNVPPQQQPYVNYNVAPPQQPYANPYGSGKGGGPPQMVFVVSF